jgi:hypothetical protein
MNEQNDHKEVDKDAGEQRYVLRMWPAGEGSWQASLQEVKSGRRIGFNNLEALFTYLMDAAEKHNRPAA